ncbi:hypothetical protein E3N88_32802 [Mikania micrantha]|uniref:Uncharacterized protein n=1 Tax=Mikania micrantha TaxID=192012 RepID=A0A5N6MA09_9ASTR|nr:hypothetical protein E3N88_32802 [Mikania micrantha]
MTKRSYGSDQSASKTHAMTGYASSVPMKTTVSFKGANGSGGTEGSYQNTTRISYGDKQAVAMDERRTRRRRRSEIFTGKMELQEQGASILKSGGGNAFDCHFLQRVINPNNGSFFIPNSGGNAFDVRPQVAARVPT